MIELVFSLYNYIKIQINFYLQPLASQIINFVGI